MFKTNVRSWKLICISHFFFSTSIFRSPTVADLSDGLVAISIEDSQSDSQMQDQKMSGADDESKKNENSSLLPNKMGYEWKEITQEFFEAVKGIINMKWELIR